MQTGWLLTGGAWYWMDPESGMMATAGSRTEGHGTILTPPLEHATGTAVIDGTRYIFDDSGACADFVDE